MAISNRKILFAAAATIAVVLCLSYYFLCTDALRRFDQQMLDAHFNLRGRIDPGGDIVIVALDDASARALNRRASGWQRADFAKAVRILSEAGADLIAIDYLFILPNTAQPQQDQEFRKAMEDSANVILAAKSQDRDVSVPYAAFREQEVGEGFINVYPDLDGIVRTAGAPKWSVTGNQLQIDALSFSLSVALSRLYPEGIETPDFSDSRFAKFADLRIPWAGLRTTDFFYINYTGPADNFPRLPIRNVIGEKFDPKVVRGKIVLIGNMNVAEHDYFAVPMRLTEEQKKMRTIAGWPSQTIQSMFGVEIHANAIHTLLHRRFLAPMRIAYAAVLLGIVAIILTWLALVMRGNAFLAVGVSAILLAALAFGSYRAFLAGTVIPAAPIYFAGIAITLTGLASRQLQEAAERRHVTSLFGRYVAPNVVKELIENRDLMQLGGRKQRLTIFFSDVRGFTSMSEKLPPEEVCVLLNEYFSRMTRIVFKHGGTLDKFIGDALMAFFGNPIYFEDHAHRAVAMALEMKAEMVELKNKWAAEGKENSFDIGMGINTGDVVVGNLGSADFFDYTVIGDEVNLACRLESVAARSQILISESTCKEVKDSFEIKMLEPVMVKGKSHPVQIYEVLSRKGPAKQ